MKFVIDLLLDGLIDLLPVLPVLLAVYLLIELVEYKKYMEFEHSPLLTGKWSPFFGALVGSIPQCGFSVAATDLFVHGTLSMGALVAVYLATSDEALPILLSHPDKYPYMFALIGIKLLIAVIAGLCTGFLIKKNHTVTGDEEHITVGCCDHDVVHEDGEKDHFEWKHPVVHSLKIFAYLFAVNLIMSLVIHLIGEDNLTAFLQNSRALQPLLAALVGLIPNCAASVVMSEMFLLNGLSFGALVTGLSVNAGLGFLVLYKENRNIRENLLITAIVMIAALSAGYILLLFT